MTNASASIRSLEVLPLDDADGVLMGWSITEFDATLDVVADLEGFMTACLDEALVRGATIAWLGFEGSFDFGHLLTADVGRQIYGIADFAGIALAVTEEQRLGARWHRRLATARASLI